MTTLSYSDLALGWSIDSQSDRRYNVITVVVVLSLLSLGVIFSSVELPVEKREARREVPPRIANFLVEKKKAAPKIEKPKPKPKEVKPKPKPKPKVKKVQKEKVDQKPLTKTEEQAREKAAASGLLALSNELADLMDTEDITAMVGGKVDTAEVSTSSNKTNQDLLLADSGSGSGGVGDNQGPTTVGKTVLSKREVSAVKQSLVTAKAKSDPQNSASGNNTGSTPVRSEEGLTLVFDQNKSVLYSLYNRARRKNPGLKGKIILELTITPSGKVTQIKIVSSELNDAKLESSILKRIKQFNFGAQEVKEVKVTYPIVFLPS